MFSPGEYGRVELGIYILSNDLDISDTIEQQPIPYLSRISVDLAKRANSLWLFLCA